MELPAKAAPFWFSSVRKNECVYQIAFYEPGASGEVSFIHRVKTREGWPLLCFKSAGMWKWTQKVKIEGSTRLWVVGALAVVEAVLVMFLWTRPSSQAQIAFLMKVGSRYVLAWKDSESKFDSVVYSDLAGALQFADEELGLRRGRNLLETGDVEYSSFRDRPAGYVVQWKIMRQPFVNQLTFQSQSEARYFLESIKGGSYAPSPFGHSLLFIPKAN